MFKIAEEDKGFTHKAFDGSGRLKIHQIPENLLTRITAESKVKAIKSVSEMAKAKILEIREKEPMHQLVYSA